MDAKAHCCLTFRQHFPVVKSIIAGAEVVFVEEMGDT